ncbi:hypothetical protein [Sutcliffiella deserti]|uniref:hypothetical protein n=1 Tax=Sutcliffiella deserti TaxID=2875501 RepID=UPI001CBBE787|nr:hypothetical protein [Sutcliffiella deserti]
MWFIVCVLLILLFPILTISNMPFLLFLPVGIIFYIYRYKDNIYPLSVNSFRNTFPKEYLLALTLSAVYFIGHGLFLSIVKGSLSLKDISYFVFPIMYLLLIPIFSKIKFNHELLKIYFYVNVILVILVKAFPPFAHVIKVYYDLYAKGNIASPSTAITAILARPAGLLVHPALYGFLIYFIAKYLSIKEPKYKYFYILMALFVAGISGGRAAILTIIILEGGSFILKGAGWKTILKRFSLISVSSLLLFVALFFLNPFFNWWITTTFQDLVAGGSQFRSHSIGHRMKMYQWFIEGLNPINGLFGGRITLESLETLNIRYIDSELVMRMMQFGIIGYLLFATPFIVFYYRAKKYLYDKPEVRGFAIFCLLFLLLGSVTTTIMTKMVFVLFASMIIAVFEREIKNNGYRESKVN